VFNRFFQLPKPERRDLFPAFRRLVVVRICLLAGIRKTLAWQDRRGLAYKTGGQAGAARDDARDLEIWQRRALALKRIAPRLPRTHCLARALALRGWMRSVGLDAEMKIGIRTGPDGLESHAWVELDHTPIDETPENVATYTLLPFQQAKSASWHE
jgi:hypothetical protein